MTIYEQPYSQWNWSVFFFFPVCNNPTFNIKCEFLFGVVYSVYQVLRPVERGGPRRSPLRTVQQKPHRGQKTSICCDHKALCENVRKTHLITG